MQKYPLKFSRMTHRNFRIKWKGSCDLVTLVSYHLDAQRYIKAGVFLRVKPKRCKQCWGQLRVQEPLSVFSDLTTKK